MTHPLDMLRGVVGSAAHTLGSFAVVDHDNQITQQHVFAAIVVPFGQPVGDGA